MEIWMIIVLAVVAIILIFVLIGLAFDAGYKRDIKKKAADCLWCDRKRNRLGLPWTFSKYSISEDRIFVQRGLFRTIYDEVRLYRILDVKMSQSLWQKIIAVGSIEVHSSDKSLGCFTMINIKKPMMVKELLSNQVEEQRDKHRVYSRESMHDMPDEYEDHHDSDDIM